jgi:hypothetical protein
VTGPSRRPVLSRRELNRATLDRQLLLRRADRTALDVITHLVGLQGQDPDPPYVGLWNRIAGFRVDELIGLLTDRRVVRGTLYRGTQHLVAADDYVWLRPMLQPMLDGRWRGAFGRQTAGLDRAAVAAATREILTGGGLTRPELGRALAARWPDRDPTVLGWTAQALVPILHPPPDGVWGRHGPTPFALAESWLGRPLSDRPRPGDLVLRYLAAFGPATVADVQAWSGLTRLREVVEPLRPRLRTFRDEAGRELFDLPDAPRPGPDVPAPVRFLASLDNVVLAHADRSRLMTDEQRPYVGYSPTMTVDGFVGGLWKIKSSRGTATLDVQLFAPLPARAEDAVRAEGARLLRFHAAGADAHDIRLTLR